MDMLEDGAPLCGLFPGDANRGGGEGDIPADRRISIAEAKLEGRVVQDGAQVHKSVADSQEKGERDYSPLKTLLVTHLQRGEALFHALQGVPGIGKR
jgi:hypothetical protein